MLDNKCEVCGQKEPIGVACTSMPLSVAYCEECIVRGADPEIVFECWYDDFGTRFEEMACPDEVTTFKDGRYMSYREWATERVKHD